MPYRCVSESMLLVFEEHLKSAGGAALGDGDANVETVAGVK